MAVHASVCILLYLTWLMFVALAQSGEAQRNCPPGKFCQIGANCTTNVSSCVTHCPTNSDRMQQGNHLTGNCEKVPIGMDYWMDSTLYEVFIPFNQALNTPILTISFISTEEFQTNNYTFTDLLDDITFTLIGSCPYFYFTNMLKEILAFENYYDLYVPDDIVSASLALAEPVPPDDYKMNVTVTNGGNVLERRVIIVHVIDVPPCSMGPEIFVDFLSSNFTVLKSAGTFRVTLKTTGKNIPSYPFIVGIIAETDNSSAATEFTPGQYNATFTTGATVATTSIPIMAGDSGGEIQQFSLRLLIYGAIYQCVFAGNVSKASVFIIPAEKSCSITMIDGRIEHDKNMKKTTLRFSSDGDPNVKYKCKVDNERFSNCKSPMVLEDLKTGKHTITVRALCADDRRKRSIRKFKFEIP